MTSDPQVTEPAAAKINLTLHITGQRNDGYHTLDSLVMFTALADEITVAPADELTMMIDGPFADDLAANDDNLVLRAARAFGVDQGAAITLTKNLPVASGIGGGSADAAATLRALSRLWDLPLPDADVILSLGADVPVCMDDDLTRMRGIGERIETLGAAPMLDILLVNPMVPVSTKAVFDALTQKSNALMDEDMPDTDDIDAWTAWLHRQRNDLQAPAIAAAPVIADVIATLNAQNGCTFARMSGSGATCFAFFDAYDTRDVAAAAIRAAHPDWWVAETEESYLTRATT